MDLVTGLNEDLLLPGVGNSVGRFGLQTFTNCGNEAEKLYGKNPRRSKGLQSVAGSYKRSDRTQNPPGAGP